ncbi:hypothetical protein LOTGIDRAFT_165548 [Lottia gigantea]|uniref:Uncharacterized protein n=1 Tax=Lottia gigantea TaxID=225164 RepID=V4BII5_LOTGI|nr:hypothetical protein LOTGIDRAFT_165548 [Lottia gigantea]ESO88424.1 hypothetical protein LOTGIDRAFT_165548 [Lottia gigantea]
MKAETLILTFNGKKISITKKLIDEYKYCKVRDDIDLERIDANAKEGGFLPFLLPLIVGGIAAAGEATGGISAAVKAANAKKATDAKAAEERRHNLAIEKEARDEEEALDDYADDYTPIIQEIDNFDDMVASGQGITFLSDNNEELLNRLRVILAAMKEENRSHRQYNEANCILKGLLEKGQIDKNDYKSVIKNVK